MDALTKDTIVSAAKELGHPTTGEFAEALWRLCSGIYGLTPSQAANLYRECGYQPFAGYPLTRLQTVRIAA